MTHHLFPDAKSQVVSLAAQPEPIVIDTGCTTSVCVESTVRDAMFRDYACVLLADCMGEPIGQGMARSNHEASLLVIQTLFGWISGADEFVRSLEVQSMRAADFGSASFR